VTPRRTHDRRAADLVTRRLFTLWLFQDKRLVATLELGARMRLSREYPLVYCLVLGLVALGCGESGAPNPPPPPVTVTAVTPTTGPLTGGTGITITGTNFTDVTSVRVGSNELGSRTIVSSTQITGTTPAATSPGAKDVVVTSTTHGAGTCNGCFSYAEDEPSSLTFTALGFGSHHNCGLTSEGAAYCWGDNQTAQLGLGTSPSPDRCLSGGTPCSTLPMPVSGGVTFASLAVGALHTCGVTAGGTAYCWGSNRYAELGIGTATGPEGCIRGVSPCSRVPMSVTGSLSFASLSDGVTNSHQCGITTTGTAYCWGINSAGQLGIGTATGPESCPADQPPKPCSSVPVPVEGGLRFRSVSAGSGYTCGVTDEGAAHCWGDNSGGQLGDGTTTDRLTPVPVAGGLRFTMVRAGFIHTCGVTTAGDAYCWGFNLYGKLGDGSPEETVRLTPTLVAGGLRFADVSVASDHNCGLTTDGAAFCWGYNGGDSPIGGLLGDGTTTNRSTPVPVAGGLTFTAVSGSCALTAAGAAYCWGDNQFGQLGDGTTTQRLTPVQVVLR
jgi:alpha-tubulin suppressor-like RCC1 family protein